jgi:tRNA (guanine37-N1)-methyltransferase
VTIRPGIWLLFSKRLGEHPDMAACDPGLKVSVISAFAECLVGYLDASIIGRARRSGALQTEIIDPRSFAPGRHQVIDHRPAGGGPGMVLAAPPLADAIDHARLGYPDSPRLLVTSPQGRRFDQRFAEELAQGPGVIMVCGHYEGIDERLFEEYQPEEVSLGDFVLTGGEIAALVMIDAVARLIPGVLGEADSAVDDSFSGDGLLDHPCYTKPAVWRERSIPAVLQGGDHQAIAAWRRQQRLQRTQARRPDLL